MQNKQIEDRWQQALEEKRAQLQKCQQDRGLKSCLGCEKVFECELRDGYVNSVYESMNKGQGGGFEF